MLNVKVFTFNPIQENTYLLFNEHKNAIIIDPGCYGTAEQETLKQFIQTNNLHVKQLINTHCHLDHVFGNKFVGEQYKVELHIHPLEQLVLQYAPISGEKWGLPFENYDGQIHLINDTSTIKLDTDLLQVLHTPGHSPGSISLYCKEQGFVISGDVLFYQSIGRTDLPGGNHEILLQSIKEQLLVLPDETIVHSGHGRSTNIGFERNNNPFF
jgi:hydroxyacylglutathione hydrolase